MPVLAATTFLSAYLLFQVQPLMGRIVLPWFGGTPAVWTTCMLFFQVVLLGGYAWSHWLATRVAPRQQPRVHLALLGAACLALAAGAALWGAPLLPDQSLRPPDASAPTARILLVLAAGAGLPYFVLSTTGPLLQAWTARLAPGGVPWRLYAVSNAGSMLGLLLYPVVMEPLFTVRTQAWVWGALFAAFVACCAILAVKAGRRADPGPTPSPAAQKLPVQPGPTRRLAAWVALPAIASVMLLAVTNQLTQEVAPVPFLWVVPLMLYLGSFVLTFDSDRWYRRGVFIPLFALASAAVGKLLHDTTEPRVALQIAAYGGVLFTGCMIMHGELARLKPAPRHLTAFYLAVSSGGAAGGLFVGLLAPSIFRGFWELHLSIAGAWVALLAALLADRESFLRGRFGFMTRPLVAACTLAVVGMLSFQILERMRDAQLTLRNFYGVLRVKVSDASDETLKTTTLLNGRIIHGVQHASEARRRLPATYYTAKSGVGAAIVALRRVRAEQHQGVTLGAVGLGVGTLAAWGRSGDTVRFYEINPLVARLAKGEGGWFSYLPDSKGKVEVVLGDARLSLERELASPRGYDILAVDAFSSDSIPFHLLTLQSVALYLKHLAPDGILAMHVTSRYLDLKPVVVRIAGDLGLEIAMVRSASSDPSATEPQAYTAVWLLLARTRAVLDAAEIASIREDELPGAGRRVWTDDYVAPLEALAE